MNLYIPKRKEVFISQKDQYLILDHPYYSRLVKEGKYPKIFKDYDPKVGIFFPKGSAFYIDRIRLKGTRYHKNYIDFVLENPIYKGLQFDTVCKLKLTIWEEEWDSLKNLELTTEEMLNESRS